MPGIRLHNVEKHFGSLCIVPELNLELDDGEFTVLVGPSGCGKSTTLRMLAGLEHLSAGEIYFDDRPVSHLEPKDRDLAMVFQDYSLYPHMNIARNMSFALRLQRVKQAEIDRKVTAVADMLNIGHLLLRKPAELSGGQRQRVAMGRALVRDASTFLFDEPLSNLDAKLRTKMRTELAEMRNSLDKNMIYVTHDQIEAMTLGDRIVVMLDGEVQQQGTPKELFETPANRFVAGFIGSPSMNFLPGDIEQSADHICISGEGFRFELNSFDSSRLPSNASKVVVGIRPSSFTSKTDGSPTINLRLVVTEYLGNHSILVTRCGSQEVLVESHNQFSVDADHTLSLSVPEHHIMLFDADSGRRL